VSGWNAEQYLKFRDERTQPAVDLAARIAINRPGRIIDLGCGPGNSTEVLRVRWPEAHVAGLDSSPEMIAKARSLTPDGDWILADLANWRTDEQFDLVFSNATLQWVAGHEELIPRLFEPVAAGGALAVQVPANNRSPLHLALLSTACRPEWKAATAGCGGMMSYHEPGFYYDLLSPRAERVTLWQTTYLHILPDPQGLIDWYASTGMKTYLARLADESERSAFSQQVLDACRDEYPPQSDGKILFPFQRTFFIAYRVCEGLISR